MMTTIDVNLLSMVTGGGKGQPGATQPQQQPGDQASAQPGGGGFMDFLSQIQSWLGTIGSGSQHLQQIFAGIQGLIGDIQPLMAQAQPSQQAASAQSADA
jgi:hypothetical protein